MNYSNNYIPQLVSPAPQQCCNQPSAVNISLVGVWVIFLCSCLALGYSLGKSHRVHRDTVRQEQIETLEKLWQISPDS